MPVPTDKTELLQQSEDNFKKLWSLLDQLSPEEQTKDFKPGTMNRNIRDVLAHLHHWHLMFLNWYEVGMNGEKPDMPAKGYSWKDTKALNLAVWQQYQTTELEKIKDKLVESHAKVHAIILSHSNEELFEKMRYHWTGTSSLSTYIRGNTSSHYTWAIKLIKKGLMS